jgi:hypothetical protein
MRLRPLLVVIAFVGLLLTVIVQTSRLQQAAARENRLRAELQLERAAAEASRQHALAAVDQLFTSIAGQQAAGGTSGTGPPGELLEQSLKFYERMQSNGSSPELRTRAVERAREIRSRLDEAADPGRM